MTDFFVLAHLKQAVGNFETHEGFTDDTIMWARVDEAGPIAGGGCRRLIGFDGYSSAEKLREIVPDADGLEPAWTLADVRKACDAYVRDDYPDSAVIFARVSMHGPADRHGARPLRGLQAFASLDLLRRLVPGVDA